MHIIINMKNELSVGLTYDIISEVENPELCLR